MALGGVLRAALKAGDWARAAAQSRRQARALRSFSPEFGSRTGRGGPEGAYDFLRRRGVDVSQYDDAINPMNQTVYMSPTAGGGFGRTVSDWEGSGFREMVPPRMYSPIVAPYEGGRSLPMVYEEGAQSLFGGRPGPWVGRGRPTRWTSAQFPFHGDPTFWSPSSPNVPRAFYPFRPYDGEIPF